MKPVQEITAKNLNSEFKKVSREFLGYVNIHDKFYLSKSYLQKVITKVKSIDDDIYGKFTIEVYKNPDIKKVNAICFIYGAKTLNVDYFNIQSGDNKKQALIKALYNFIFFYTNLKKHKI